jgi:cation transport ATPase
VSVNAVTEAFHALLTQCGDCHRQRHEAVRRLHVCDWVISHKQVVFARTSLEQKMRTVKECQSHGEVVAITGDDTNDAPA